ncbi:hypothetical protein ACSSS7_000689 [Eimeria intestinalis]
MKDVLFASPALCPLQPASLLLLLHLMNSSSSSSSSDSISCSSSDSSKGSSGKHAKSGGSRRWGPRTSLAIAVVPAAAGTLLQLKQQHQQKQDHQQQQVEQQEEALALPHASFSPMKEEMRRLAAELRAMLPGPPAFLPLASGSSSSKSSSSSSSSNSTSADIFFPVWDMHAWLRFSRSFSSLVVSTLDYKWTFRRLAAMEAREEQLAAAAAAATAAAAAATAAEEDHAGGSGGSEGPECAQRHQAEASRLATEAAMLRARRQTAEQELHERGARRFLRVCIDHGGLYTKLGQYIATLQHVLPTPYITILSQLQDDAARLPWPQAKAMLEAELGGPLDAFFAEFDEEAVAAASLAQVHRARRRSDGAEVAVKLQRPRLQQNVASDLMGLRVLMSFVSMVFPHCRFSWLLPEFETNMRQELNFKQEGFNAMRLRRLLATAPDVYVPWVDWALTTERVLTMEFVRGAKLTDAEALQREGIEGSHQVAAILMRVFGDMLHLHGLVHCDPHPGNLLVRRKPKHSLQQQQQQQQQQGGNGTKVECCSCTIARNSHQQVALNNEKPASLSSSSSNSNSSSSSRRNEGALQLVVLDHGMYRRLSPHFRVAFSRLWLALLLNDVNEGRQALRDLGIQKHIEQQQKQQQQQQQQQQQEERQQRERRWAASFPGMASPPQETKSTTTASSSSSSGSSSSNNSSSSGSRKMSAEEEAMLYLDEDTALDLLSVVLTYRPQVGLRTQLGAPLDSQDRAKVFQALRGAPMERINGVLQLLPRDLLWVLRMSYLIRSINCDMGGSTKDRLVAMGEAACRGVQLRDTNLDAKLAECEAFAAASCSSSSNENSSSRSSSIRGDKRERSGVAPRWFELPGCKSLNLPVASEYPAYSTWFFHRGEKIEVDAGVAADPAGAAAATTAAGARSQRSAAAAASSTAAGPLNTKQQQQLQEQLVDPLEDLYTQLVLANGAEQSDPLAAYKGQAGLPCGELQEQQLLLLLSAQIQAARSNSQSPLLLHSLSGEPGPQLLHHRRRCSRCGNLQIGSSSSSTSISGASSSRRVAVSQAVPADSGAPAFAPAAAATRPASKAVAESPWAPLGLWGCMRFLLLRTEMLFTILLLRAQLWVVDFILRLAVGPTTQVQQQRRSYGTYGALLAAAEAVAAAVGAEAAAAIAALATAAAAAPAAAAPATAALANSSNSSSSSSSSSSTSNSGSKQ